MNVLAISSFCPFISWVNQDDLDGLPCGSTCGPCLFLITMEKKGWPTTLGILPRFFLWFVRKIWSEAQSVHYKKPQLAPFLFIERKKQSSTKASHPSSQKINLLLEMAIPVIDFSKLKGKQRAETLAQIANGCEEWGFFQVCCHGGCAFMFPIFFLSPVHGSSELDAGTYSK